MEILQILLHDFLRESKVGALPSNKAVKIKCEKEHRQTREKKLTLKAEE
jgi:hypothetical protein